MFYNLVIYIHFPIKNHSSSQDNTSLIQYKILLFDQMKIICFVQSIDVAQEQLIILNSKSVVNSKNGEFNQEKS